MPQHYAEPILYKNFRSLGFSHDFCHMAETLQFHCPADMLGLPVARLEQLPGVTLHLLYEFVRFLEAGKLAHYLDD